VRDDGSKAGDGGRDDSGIGVALSGEWEYTEAISKGLGGGLGLGRDSALSELSWGVRDEGSQAGEDGRDGSGIGVVLPGE